MFQDDIDYRKKRREVLVEVFFFPTVKNPMPLRPGNDGRERPEIRPNVGVIEEPVHSEE
jgi:hypothetical protein